MSLFPSPFVGLTRILDRMRRVDEALVRSRQLVLADLGKTYAFAFIIQGGLAPAIKGDPFTGTGMALCLMGFSYHILISAWPKVIR